MKTIIFIFCLFSIACVTSRSIATYVCNKKDARAEAIDKFGGEVIEVIYDPDKNGYWVMMISRIDRRSFWDRLLGKEYDTVQFIPDNC